jgi:hypothetical protein
VTRRRQLFLIVGSGRCGTTFLHDVLQAHPRIALTNEAHVLDFLYFAHEFSKLPDDTVAEFPFEVPARLRGVVTPAYVARFAPIFERHARLMIEEFYATEFRDKDFTHFGDKLPAPLPAAAARRLFPDVQYVALVRDPRDYVCSARAYARLPRIAGPYPHLDVPLERHCAHWSFVNRGILDHLRLDPIRYEDLIQAPEATVGAVLDALGLPSDAACTAAIADRTSFAGQATSGSPAASVGRWRRELDCDEVRLVEARCGELMARLGYLPVTA